jgi:hypothetical protein
MKAALALTTLVSLVAVLAAGCGTAERSEDLAQTARNAPTVCAIATYNGHYLTAVGGGGRTSDVLHTDATRIGSWEKFVLEDAGEGNGVFGFKTFVTGHYLTAVGGGGRITDVMHSDATAFRAWERLRLVSLGGGWYAIQTNTGHYLTATGAGGLIYDAIHSDATQVQAWEKFKLTCGL